MAKEPIPRDIYLMDDVDEETSKNIIGTIHKVNREDDEKESKEVDYERKPIKIWINSPGGSAYHTLAIMNAIRLSKTEVHTNVVGLASSGAFWVSISGHLRFASKDSCFLIHDLSYEMYGKTQDHAEVKRETDYLQKSLMTHIYTLTKIKKKQIKACIKEKKDWYLTAKEAHKLGIFDEWI